MNRRNRLVHSPIQSSIDHGVRHARHVAHGRHVVDADDVGALRDPIRHRRRRAEDPLVRRHASLGLPLDSRAANV